MSITKLTPVWGAHGQPHAHDLAYVRPYTPPPRIIVGLLTGEVELDATQLVPNKTPVPREGDRR
jgi:hypothetical protein